MGQRDTLKIGLLLPDSASSQIAAAGQQAIQEVNLVKKHSYVYQLVIRSTEGPWGMGSKQSVSLVYDDQVMAMVGWLDGRNAHLAEQVAAKSHILYLETRATDPTLSQAYVPWFFRMTPSDDQQARAILEEIKKEGGRRLAILNREDYETRYAVKSMIKEAAYLTGNAPQLIPVPVEENDQEEILNQLKNAGIQDLIVPLFSPDVYTLLKRVSKEIPELRIYGTLAFTSGLDAGFLDLTDLPGIKLIHSYEGGVNQNLSKSLTASYVFDGILLIVQAIEETDADREVLKTYLKIIQDFQGLTGPATFDEMGNRSGKLHILENPGKK